MALSPFELIKQGVTGLINQGKSYLNSIPNNSTAGVVKNTITGIPEAGRNMAQGAADFLSPTYGRSRETLKKNNPFGINILPNGKLDPNQPKPLSLKETATVAGKVGSELVTGLGKLGEQGYNVARNAINKTPLGGIMSKGFDPLYNKFVESKTGGLLAGVIPSLEKYQQPVDDREAAAMSFFNTLSNAVGGSTKNLGKSSKIIAATTDPNIIAKEVKAIGLADDVIEDLMPSFIEAKDPKTVAGLITQSFIPPHLQQKAIELEIKKEALNGSPFSGMDKRGFTSKEGDVRELGDIRGKVADKMEKRMKDFNISDPKEFTQKLEQYKVDRDSFLAEEKAFNAEIKATRKSKTPVKETPPAPVVAKKPIEPANIGTGEARSLEEAAYQSSREAGQEAGSKPFSYEDIINKAPTDVKSKVGIIDVVRTPENVFRKIGLSSEFNKIRSAQDSYVKELPQNIDKITEWSKQVPAESNKRIFKYLDGEAIDLTPQEQKVTGEIKEWLSGWADRLNLPEDNRISNYITHIFDEDFIKKEFDEDLAKIISDRIPGSVYDPFLEKRLGALGYKQDTWAALDAYVKRGTRKVHMDPALSDLKKVASNMEKSQYDYVKKFIDKVNMRPSDLDTSIDNTIKGVIGYKLGQRPVAKISRLLRQVTFRGMIGGNIGSALRNLSQGVNTYAKLGERYTISGYIQLARKGTKELKELGIFADNFITDRKLSATKKGIEKLDKVLFSLFDSAEKINRGAAFYGAKSKALAQGKTLEQAIEYGKKIVRDTQFNYSAIDTPLAMQDDITKVLTQFLTYPVKQTEFLAGMAKNKEYMGILRYVLGAAILPATVGGAIGMKPTDFIPFYGQLSGEQKFGTPPSLKLPVELAKAALNTPDEYGQPRDLSEKAADIGNTLWGILPAGSQIKKTMGGVDLIKNDGSFTDEGKKRFDGPTSNSDKVKALLFGQYNTSGGQQYIEGGFKTQTVAKTKKEIAQEVLTKLKSGEFGSEAVAKEYFKDEIKKSESTQATNRMNLPPKEYAQELLNKIKDNTLTEAQAKKELESYKKQQKAGKSPIETIKRGPLGIVGDYTEAFFKDPENAWKALNPFGKEKLGEVKGNLVELQRYYGIKFDAKGGSEEKRKELMLKAGIPWSEREKYNLEHITPVSAGGGNSEDNLFIANRPLHDFYTPIDIAVGNAVKSGKIDRKKAVELMTKLKVDKTMSAEEVINALK